MYVCLRALLCLTRDERTISVVANGKIASQLQL